MNYSTMYDQLILRAQSRTLTSGFERHHIVPKSLGGINNRSNIVKLTVHEHFVAHKLLIRMYNGEAKKKMWFAYYRLSNRHKITNGRQYKQAKLQAKLYLSEIHTGKKLSAEHKKSFVVNGNVGEDNPHFGHRHNDQSLEVMAQAKVGNQNARVGISVVNATTQQHLENLNSISDLCKRFDLTRGQAEHYIYKQRPYDGRLFVRQKLIKRK